VSFIRSRSQSALARAPVRSLGGTSQHDMLNRPSLASNGSAPASAPALTIGSGELDSLVTVDRATGFVVSGDRARPIQATELWTFRRDDCTRADGWQVSAIQQAA
jgi:Tim44-like domain